MYFVAISKVNRYKMGNSFMYENIYTRSKPLCETELEIIITYVVAYNDSALVVIYKIPLNECTNLTAV